MKFELEEKKVYAVDFDGTLAETDYPSILYPKYSVIQKCKQLKREGNILILWTCRCGKALKDAIEFCKEQGLHFDYVNENIPEYVAYYGSDSRKIFADYYIDDRALPYPR